MNPGPRQDSWYRPEGEIRGNEDKASPVLEESAAQGFPAGCTNTAVRQVPGQRHRTITL